MSKVKSIDGGKLPRDLAEYILENEKDIKSAVLTLYTHSEPGTATHLFSQMSTGELSYAILTLMVAFIQELAEQATTPP